VKKIRLLVTAILLVVSFTGHAYTATAKSGWIEGDQDEVRLPVNRPVQQQNQQPDQQQTQPNDWRSPDSTGNPPPSLSGRGYQAADSQSNDRSMGGSSGAAPGEGAMDQSGHPLDSMDDLDKRPVQTSKLTIHEGGSNVITGGVTSANFRTGKTMNRGTDDSANVLLERAPYLTPNPRTVAVQTGTFKGWLDRTHNGEASTFSKTTVVEVKGQWDDCGHIIRSFGLPFTRISPSALTRADLTKTKILVVNCGANFDADQLSAIREFVAHGGFLLTTDWALDSCLQKAFPGYVEWNGGYTDNSVVDAVIVDRDPELTKGMPKVGYWKLEDKSQTVQVIRRLEVQVLVRSRVLMQREPSQLGILALTFPYGDGQILHLVGHFDNNADRAFNNALPDPAPIIGIALRQAIATNFIMAAAREGGVVPIPTAKADEN